MTMAAVQDPSDPEAALQAFLSDRPEAEAIRLRTLAHAWTGGGGQLRVGSLTVRLVAGTADKAFTAGTLHASRGEHPGRLELARVLLEKHGVDEDRWVYWADEFADLIAHGFDRAAKYPAVPVEPLTDSELVRLVMGLRDLARMASS